ncbi:MAG: long-chain fatty acid--CoA ligase [Deltaproteobacteria bacterium]|nr:long-chain fatty acid--CoA ligase [Deltaproteobacteria bacterium]
MIHGDWLAKWSMVDPDKVAFVDLAAEEEISYGALNARADRAANMLRTQFGVGLGQRVAVLGANRMEQVALFFAVAKLGAILVPVNWRLAAEEVAWVLGDSTPEVLFFGADLGGTALALAGGLWSGAMVGFDDEAEDGYAERLARSEDKPQACQELNADSPLMLLYTSGTTGRPKGAVLTHGSITWNAINTDCGWDLRGDDVTVAHAPLFHTGGWNVLTLPLIHRGATVLLARKFDASETLRAIEKYKVTVLFAVPTMFQMMLERPEFGQTDLSSMRFFISGGAPCPISLIEAYAAFGLTFKQGYGLTEVGPNCFVLHERDAIRKAGSVGFPVLHLDTRLVEVDGQPVGPGEVGELQLKGPTVCAGYWNNLEDTAKALDEDGWFATGDLFRIDEQGYHHVVGRLKEMYISGGENVYPAEVERVLYQLPEIVEAAVIGKADEKWGEVGYAFVAFDPACQDKLSEEVILAHCRKQLAKYKVPKGLQIMESLPKGPSGKILKKALWAANP